MSNKPHFFEYQKRIFNDTSRYINIVKSRQIGITYLLAYKALVDCIEKNIDVVIISSNQENSNNFINYIDRWMPIVCPIYGVTVAKYGESTKKFSNGHRIICLSSNPRTIGGKTGTVILDEFANVEDQEAVYNEAKPIISTNKLFQFIICSAPAGKNDLFYQITEGKYPYNNYSQHKITIEDAINDGFDQLSIEDAHDGLDDKSYENKYMAEFIDEGHSCIPYAILTSNEEFYNPYSKSGDIYIGVDVGSLHDRTSAVKMIKNGSGLYLKDIEDMKTSDYDSRTKFIDTIIEKNKPKKIWIDSTGIGLDWSNSISKKYPSIVECKPFTNPFKNEMVEFNILQLEQHKTKFPTLENGKITDSISLLYKQLNSCKKSVTKSNNTVYTFKRDKTGHSDSAIAFMLAVLASKSSKKIPQIWIPGQKKLLGK